MTTLIMLGMIVPAPRAMQRFGVEPMIVAELTVLGLGLESLPWVGGRVRAPGMMLSNARDPCRSWTLCRGTGCFNQ
jgi:hypothetical protein